MKERIETKRLILRSWKDEDAGELYRYAKDDRVGPIAGWPIHTSVENSREIIREVLSAEGTYAVVLKETNLPIGSIGLMRGKASNIEIPDTEAEIGYWIGVPYWGKGLIPEAVRELMRYAFDELKLDKLWCGYFDGNAKSYRVQEKCGFIYHHTNENIFWPVTGDIRTEHITCITRNQWKGAIVETPRLYLRKMTQDDFPQLCKILQDSEVMYAYEGAFCDEEAQEWMDRQLKRYEEYGNFGLWAVILKETDAMIGQCGLTMQDGGGMQVLEIGYLFQKAYWHEGYASEAAGACKKYAFDTLQAEEVFSIIRDTNTASRNVAVRNGMTIWGELMKHYKGIDMRHIIYSVKKSGDSDLK